MLSWSPLWYCKYSNMPSSARSTFVEQYEVVSRLEVRERFGRLIDLGTKQERKSKVEIEMHHSEEAAEGLGHTAINPIDHTQTLPKCCIRASGWRLKTMKNPSQGPGYKGQGCLLD